MDEPIQLYENYLMRLESLVYDHIAIKLATFKAFEEILKKDYNRSLKCFPSLLFIVESLQIDCVLTTFKITEENKKGMTFPQFFNYVIVHLETICTKYPAINSNLIEDNKKILNEIKDQSKRIKDQRNKYYAHSDNEYFLEPNKLRKDFPTTYNDLSDIISALQEIICNLRNAAKGKCRVCMSNFAYLNAFNVMERLIKLNDDIK